MTIQWRHLGLTIASAGLLMGMQAAGGVTQTDVAVVDTPDTSSNGLQQLEFDRSTRMTVPVSINNSVPFNFVVDTGAERTVISNELGEQLALNSGPKLKLATLTGITIVDSYLLDRLTMSSIEVGGINAPAIRREYLGAYGLLGIDSLAKHKVKIDFKKQEMSILPSKRRDRYREAGDGGDVIIVTADRRAGRLVLTDAQIGDIKVDIVIDTGAQGTMGNSALRKKLTPSKRRDAYSAVSMRSVTGESFTGDFTRIKEVTIDNLVINDLPVAIVDDFAFKALRLHKRPAILFGMDALRMFDRVEIDFANKKVVFDLPRRSDSQSRARLAWKLSRTSAISLSSPVTSSP